jgi:hypothetical protein
MVPGCALQPTSDSTTTAPSAGDDEGTWQVVSGNNLCILLNTKTGKTWSWNGAAWMPMNGPLH